MGRDMELLGDRVVAILEAAPRLQTTRNTFPVVIATIAAHPGKDAEAAAHEAVRRSADPSYGKTNAQAVFRDALQDAPAADAAAPRRERTVACFRCRKPFVVEQTRRWAAGLPVSVCDACEDGTPDAVLVAGTVGQVAA